MRIWGYILIFLNLVAAGAFVYFAFAVRKARTEWQFALLKQELVNRGLPMEAPDQPGDDIDEDSVPFDFRYGEKETLAINQIKKDKLKTLIPKGGDVLGADGNEIITNQTDEVKRVEKKVFGQLDTLSGADKRKRLMTLLVDLSKNSGREGAYALLRDYLDDKRRAKARFELSFLGRTESQQTALRALAAIGALEAGFGPNVDQKIRDDLILRGRKALGEWAKAEVFFAVPNPVPPGSPPSPDLETDPYNIAKENAKKEREDLLKVFDPFLKEVQKATPNQAIIDAGKNRLTKDLLEGENKLASKNAAFLLPYLAEIGGNLLNTPEDLAAAKVKLLELIDTRTTTESEKRSIAATVDLMVPTKDDKAQLEKKVETAALELLRAYFEETTEKASATPDKKPLRTPGEKKRNIAHLLYHLDSHVGGSANSRNKWFESFVMVSDDGKEPNPNLKMPPYDGALSAKRAEWHARVVAIVGFEAYISAAEAQASRLGDLSKRLRARIVEEQSAFVQVYQSIVLDTLDYSRELAQRNVEVAKQMGLLQEANTNLTIRETERDDLQNELAKITATAKKALNNLEAKVEELYQITKKLGEAQDALVGLEIQLRDLEIPKATPKK